jgi:hypothetical protein
MDMGSIAAAASSLKAAADIAKALSELKTFSEVQGKVIDLQREILAAQSSALLAQSEQFTMLKRIDDLEKEIAHVKAWEAQKQRYQLHEPRPSGFVYALKKSMSGGEPAHWICTHCYEDGRKSILYFEYHRERGPGYYCPKCTTMVHYPVENGPESPSYAKE